MGEGYIQTQEHRRRVSIALTGRVFSDEHRRRISESRKGTHHPHSDEARKNMSLARMGWKPSDETKARMSVAKSKPRPYQRGANNRFWKGGVTAIHLAIRCSLEYEQWRKSVFERDNYTCQHCGQVGGYLQADHIKPFALYPKLRMNLDNGRTLCRSCHRKTDTYGRKLYHFPTR